MTKEISWGLFAIALLLLSPVILSLMRISSKSQQEEPRPLDKLEQQNKERQEK